VSVTASSAIPAPAGHAGAPKAARFCPSRDRERRTGEQRGCASGNLRLPKTMRPISINRQFSTRPITVTQRRSARWSAGTSKTLREANTISGPGALILPVLRQAIIAVGGDFLAEKMARQLRTDSASVRISAAASAASPVRFVPACAESRPANDYSRAGSRCATTLWRPAQADSGRSERARPGLCTRAISSRHSARVGRCSAARPAFGSFGHGRSGRRPYLGGGANCGPVDGFMSVPRRVTCAIQTLRESVKGNCVPRIENATAFS